MQTKPLRNYGIDVTQTSFKPIMEDLGIEKSVNELSQGEKEILRYIATLNQARNAMGDFANTIESPANQLKVLKQQFYEMQAAIGNLFVGAFARILPYVNAIIMVIKELAKTIATIFGIKMKDYNTGIASYEDGLDDYSESLGGVADSANGANDAIKKLNRQTLAFDQINNLTSPTPSSGGSGGGAGGGVADLIDQKLLDALKGYENGMEKVRMKAVKIRDKIMEWLGFQKEINKETGETYFTYDTVNKTIVDIAREIATNLGNMLNYYTNKIDWAKLGEYLAIGLNTAFTFIDTFIQTYDWKNLGSKIAEFLNNAIKNTDFATIGRILTDKLRVAILTLSGFLENFDFKEFATKLAELINGAISNIPVEDLVSGLNSLVDGIWTTIKTLVEKIDWGTLIDKVITLISQLDWDTKLLLLAPAIAKALGALFGSSIIQKIISETIVKAILNGITSSGVSSAAGSAAGTAGTTAASAGGAAGTAGTILVGSYLTFKGYKTANTMLDNLFNGKPLYVDVVTKDDNWLTSGLKGLELGTFLTNSFGKAFLPQMIYKKIYDKLKESNIGKAIKEAIDEEGIIGIFTKPFEAIIQKVVEIKDKIVETWGNIAGWVNENVVQPIQKFFEPLTNWFGELWGSIESTIEGVWKNIVGFISGCIEIVKIIWNAGKTWLETNIINPIKTKFSELWNGVKDVAKNAWEGIKSGASSAWEGIKNVFSPIVEWFKNKFKTAWEGVKNVFSTGGKIFTGIKEGIENTFKTVVNGIIGGINKVVSIPFNAINGVITKLKNISIAGKKPFENKLSYISIPQIPLLANGGMPSTGQLFIAREAGPEMVGKIGSRTTVANNQQIVQGIEKGVYNAVTSAIGSGGLGSVQIDLHTDEGVVVDRINKITRQTGVCPIDI